MLQRVPNPDGLVDVGIQPDFSSNVHERGYEVDAPGQRSRHGATVCDFGDFRDSSRLARVLGGVGAAEADRAYQQIAAAAYVT
jgi:hypothetical protein